MGRRNSCFPVARRYGGKMTLYLFPQHNYYNRKIIRFSNLDDYEKAFGEPEIFTNINFLVNDGVSTTQIINHTTSAFDSGLRMPGYCVVCDEYGSITSRWWVIDNVQLRLGQSRLSLLRDAIADYYDDIVTAPCFVEKATLQLGDPLLFNKEDMTFNQIKTKEFLLKDKTNCPWIVGYYAKNTPVEYLTGTVSTNDVEKNYDILLTTPFDSWQYNATVNPFYLPPKSITYRIYAMHMTTASGFQRQNGFLKFNKDGNYLDWDYVGNLDTPLSCNYRGDLAGAELAPTFINNSTNLYNMLKSYTSIPTSADAEYFLDLQGSIVRDSQGRIFQITLTKTETSTEVIDITAGSLYQKLVSICGSSEEITGTPNQTSFKVEVVREGYKMSAVELFGLSTTWDMRGERLVTEDAPYDIFAIPYGEVQLVYKNLTYTTSNKVSSLATANSIINKMTPAASGGYLYDIQLLPYCPINAHTNGVIKFEIGDESRFSLVREPYEGDEEGRAVTFILNIPSAQFTKNIYSAQFTAPATALEAKISNECDKYRLCSPNFSDYFDFSVAKNKGVSRFNVDCTYKPFQPYIHVNPDFNGLYGDDFNDPRGLICGGDFSLSQVSDAWQSYQIQNKNFQEIFNRQIENMEVNNAVQRTLERWNVATGTLQGSTTGAMVGGMTGGPWGAVIGGVVGGATSLAGGIADIAMNEKLRNEALDYTKDQFGYQLGNIQALPYTLTKVDSFNYNNKIFPLVEYYTCTDREKEAFKDKLKYNGMTVMAIGRIGDYITPDIETYIKGKLIRLETQEATDFHITNFIADELFKGVFINEYSI